MSIEYKKSPIKDSAEYKRVLLQNNHQLAQMDFMYDSDIRTPIYETYVKSSKSMFDDDNDNASQATERRGLEPVAINLQAEMSESGTRETSTDLSTVPPIIPPHPIVEHESVGEGKAGGEDNREHAEERIDVEEELQKFKDFLTGIDARFPEGMGHSGLQPPGNGTLDLDAVAREVLHKHRQLEDAGIVAVGRSEFNV
mmetsp:Transcript_26146/g.49081  ORF Transcript_26146/g.49081 Transcript_26146/m.49081 type:complete len:198 (-) Transcript_26146:35-628(-)